MIPFLGTVLGSACVFLLKDGLGTSVQKSLTGFAAGVMTAASVWSLIIPSIEASSDFGRLAFIPAFVGFWLGILFLLFLDRTVPHQHMDCDEAEGKPCSLGRSTMLVLAVTLHNIPEGMAVGVVFAGVAGGNTNLSLSAAFALSLGMALQNFPEGAVISMPLHAEGVSKPKSFLLGTLSGAVEPVAAFLTILLSRYLLPALPYLLGFAAGAMMYVVVEELIPEMSEEPHSNIGTIFFSLGFTLMMALDVGLA